MAASIPSKILRRLARLKSKAPVFTRCSRTRLLTARPSTRAAKSSKSAKGPFASRSAMILCAASSPTPFTPARPNRILPPTGVNISRDSLTSGPRTPSPIASHSATKWATLSAFPSSELSIAAMNSTGWLALR